MPQEPETQMMTPSDMLGEHGTFFDSRLTEDRIGELIDKAAGQGNAPRYQWYDTAGRGEISGSEIRYLEQVFFNGDHHHNGDLELHYGPCGRRLLRVRNAMNRVYVIDIADPAWLLVGFHHYVNGKESSRFFTHDRD